MNQGRIWCVVNPTVGLPLFLGSVAVTSLIVHFSVLSHTSWFSSYWGGSKAKVASVESAPAPVALNGAEASHGVVISMAPVAGKAGSGETSFLITVAAKPAAPGEAAVVGDASAPVSVALAAQGSK